MVYKNHGVRTHEPFVTIILCFVYMPSYIIYNTVVVESINDGGGQVGGGGSV